MLDLFLVLTKGGLVLWSLQFYKLEGDPINALIQNVLLQDRAGENSYTNGPYLLKWTFANDLNLIFVSVSQKMYSLSYLDNLLETVKISFCELFGSLIKDRTKIHEYPFTPVFMKIHQRFDEESKAPRVQKTYQETKKNKGGTEKQKKKSKKGIESASENSADEDPNSVQDIDSEDAPEESSTVPLTKEEIAAKIKNRKVKPKEPTSDSPKKPKIMATRKSDKITKEELEALDRSVQSSESQNGISSALISDEVRKLIELNKGDYQLPDIEYKPTQIKDSSISGKISSFFKGLTGQKVLERSDLEEPLSKMRDILIGKNVAIEIAEKLCDSVLESLIGKTVSSFTGVSSIIRESMETALQRILTPKSSTDILRDILASKEQKKTYSIVFCGVNGVGKSTNLAKICFWLLQNNLRVLIAACDTFRSGAVEQLNRHVQNLNALGASNNGIELYQKGYGKDAANIAQDAIRYANSQGFDVVLVDTAGRMQDNEPLMRALAKLVKINQPNKVFFVGEALVGNDGVDQLVKFNQALRDYADSPNPRVIDGIVLTKFDTIDDKVGAAISMCYSTGQPIVFVGTGQTYTDLKKVNVKAIVDSLLN